jgi:cell division protein FtsW (lipid II flippase)
VLAEEPGFVGELVLLALFAALNWRVLIAGWRSRDPCGTLFACGVAVGMAIGMAIGIMPITGILLPFVTHGGVSLVSLALGLGISQSIKHPAAARTTVNDA